LTIWIEELTHAGGAIHLGRERLAVMLDAAKIALS
jgi:hypothetical protein